MTNQTKVNIFEESNYDVDTFLTNHPEVKEMTEEEVKTLSALFVTSRKHKSRYSRLVYGDGRGHCSLCIFKIEDSWIVWRTDERRGFIGAKQFNSIQEASTYIIQEKVEDSEKDSAVNYFNSLLEQDDYVPSDNLLNSLDFIGYRIVTDKSKTLKRK